MLLSASVQERPHQALHLKPAAQRLGPQLAIDLILHARPQS